MEERPIMTPGEAIPPAELHGDQYFSELTPETNPHNGGMRIDKDNRPLGWGESTAGNDTLDQLQRPEQPQSTLTNTIDTQSFNDFILGLQSRQLTELALLLARHMRDQAETARLSNQSQSNVRVPSGSASTTPGGPRRGTFSTTSTMQGVPSSQIMDGSGQPEGTLIQSPQLKYIITPHPDQVDRCIKQTVGEPENIPYMPPGVYRQSTNGTMELETSFRSSGVRVVSKGSQDAKMKKKRGIGGLAGSVSGLFKKVGKLFKGKKK